MGGLTQGNFLKLISWWLGWWSQDMSLVQGMQVSMATLRAATTKHHHTDRYNGDTCHRMYLSSPAKRRKMRELRA